MKRAFRVFFNDKKQFVDVFISDSPAKFKRRNECHAYYIGNSGRKVYRGLFGFIYLSKMDDSPAGVELMTHEINHLLADWMRSRRMTPSEKNEERIATMTGEINRSFWEKWRRFACTA